MLLNFATFLNRRLVQLAALDAVAVGRQPPALGAEARAVEEGVVPEGLPEEPQVLRLLPQLLHLQISLECNVAQKFNSIFHVFECLPILDGSFSAVSKPICTSKYSFCSGFSKVYKSIRRTSAWSSWWFPWRAFFASDASDALRDRAMFFA